MPFIEDSPLRNRGGQPAYIARGLWEIADEFDRLAGKTEVAAERKIWKEAAEFLRNSMLLP